MGGVYVAGLVGVVAFIAYKIVDIVIGCARDLKSRSARVWTRPSTANGRTTCRPQRKSAGCTRSARNFFAYNGHAGASRRPLLR